MPRPTKLNPELGNARTRLLNAARDVIRRQGFAGTSVDDLCAEASVTKGAFFHHFKTKGSLGIAVAEHWEQETSAYFEQATYHEHAAPLDRVLGYIALRRDLLVGELPDFTCLLGTMIQETYLSSPEIRDACAEGLFGHAATLESDIEAAIAERQIAADWTPASLARHIQASLQGAFILAKASESPEVARESIDHLTLYIRRLFEDPSVHRRGP